MDAVLWFLSIQVVAADEQFVTTSSKLGSSVVTVLPPRRRACVSIGSSDGPEEERGAARCTPTGGTTSYLALLTGTVALSTGGGDRSV